MPLRCIVMLSLLLWSLSGLFPTHARVAAGSDHGTDHSVTVERHVQHFVVEPDGSYTLTVEQVKTIATRDALHEHAQHYISYNGSLDQVVSVEAHTDKADGRKLAVQPHQIRDQQEAASFDAPMFQDTRLKIVVFPDVQPGDRVALRYVVRRHTPLFPAQFEDLTAARFHRQRDFRLIYDMPPSMPLHADAVGFETLAGAGPPGKRRYAWRYVDGDNARIEADSVSYLDYGKRLAVSTFADYAAFARAYQERAAGKALADDTVAALAARVAGDKLDRRERAIALSDWVRRNVRYVGVYLGPGGVVPHPAASVLANRYGDCKDHATLLEALLASAGIDSTVALVNNGDAYRLPEVPTLGVLNHAIVYVPSLQLYLDPTADAVAGGFLPPGLLGKPAVLARSGEFTMIPFLQPARSRTLTRFDIGRDGSSRFRVTRTSSGAQAEPYRRVVRATASGERERFVERMLQGLGHEGGGVLEPGDLDSVGDDYTLSFRGASDSFAQLPGPAGLATTYHFWGGLGDAVQAFAQEPQRRQEFVCPAIDAEDELQFRLPKRTTVLALPRALKVEDANFAYRSRYERRGALVTVKRQLKFRHTAATCSPDDYRRMRPALERMLRDLRTQVVVKGG
jgi:transglutaminase-like putative cysteine protease